jgi:glycosyltransferase involved in cell wall biosynthesis
VLRQLAEAQANAGLEVVVATTNMNSLTETGVYRDPGWDTLANGAVPIFYGAAHIPQIMFSYSLGHYLRKNIPNFDVVHVHGFYRFPTTFAAYWSRRQGIPYIIRPHGALDPYVYDKSAAPLRLKRLYERRFDMPNLQAASAVHYTAEDERVRTSALGLRSPSFVIPNGLDWERYRALPERGELRSRLGIGNAPIVLFLGRMHFKKGLDLLVPAFQQVCRARPDARLLIVGHDDDGYEKKVRRWVSERGLDSVVHFVGPLQGVDVSRAYVDADVFVLPSYTENFGMAVVEAMGCGLPVVISDQVNIHHEISESRSGLVTHCDAGEVANAVLSILSDPDLARRMGIAGRRLVEERYSWPHVTQALTTEYERAIARGQL